MFFVSENNVFPFASSRLSDAYAVIKLKRQESSLTAPTITASAVFVRFFFEEKFSNQKSKCNYKDGKGDYFLNHNVAILEFGKQSTPLNKPIHS